MQEMYRFTFWLVDLFKNTLVSVFRSIKGGFINFKGGRGLTKIKSFQWNKSPSQWNWSECLGIDR